MSGHADESLELQLRVLRREYLADSSQRVEELRRILARLAAGERAALAELRQAFHRLAGSGGSYGFPQVSACSREGEHIAQALEASSAAPAAAQLGSLDACIRAVAEAFGEARQSLDREPPPGRTGA